MGIFGNAFSGWHLVIILFIIVLLFGAAKLPALASSIGKSVRILKKETKADDDAQEQAQAQAQAQETLTEADVPSRSDAPAAPSGNTPHSS